MDRLIDLKKGLTRLLEWLVIIIMGVMVLDYTWQIIARVFQIRCDWTDALASHLLVWAGLLGASVAFARKSHIGIDMLVSRLDAESKRFVAFLSLSITMFFAGFVMVRGGWGLVMQAFNSNQRSVAFNMPYGIVYLAIPISGVFIVLFAFEQLCELFMEEKKSNVNLVEPVTGEEG